MRIALFADIHGKFLLPFKLVDLYQRTTGFNVDLILQCGDMGAYPDLSKLDKATLRHAKRDRDELGFHDDFIKENPKIKSFLDALNIKMICVRGNHEDHDFLNILEAQYPNDPSFPIDVYKKVWVCKTGWIQSFSKEDQTLKFIGIGRIGDRKGRKDQKFIQDYERAILKKLQKTKEEFDLLIAHDKDASSQRGFGMIEIRELLDNVYFQYYFHGHTGEPFSQQQDVDSFTTIVKIKELEFDSNGILPEGCMIIVKKDDIGDINIEVIQQKLTNQITKHNWKYL